MKFKKFLILIFSALSLIALSISLSACSFLDGIFGEKPSEPDPEPSVCVHEYGGWYDDINTCTEHTLKCVCRLCGDTKTLKAEPKGHSFGEWFDTEKTCTVHTQVRICSECRIAETVTEEIEDHSYGAWREDAETCTEHTRRRYCNVCGTWDTETVPAAGHKYGEWTDAVNTCTLHTQKRACAVCKEEETRTLTAAGHKYGGWVDNENTCTKHIQIQTCSVCGNIKSQTLTPKGHSYGEWEDLIKTCTKHIQRQVCAGCGDVLKRELKAAGHKYTQGVCEYCKESFYEGSSAVLDKYNGTYGYEYFKTENLTAQYTLYERIDASVRTFHMDSEINAEQITNDGKSYYVASTVEYSDLGLTFDGAAAVWKTYRDDNPLYYWMTGNLLGDDNRIKIISAETYAQGSVRAQTNDFIYSIVSEYSLIPYSGDNAYRKALAFHDKIISSINYAYDENNLPQSADWAHSIIGVFEEKGAVCEGYAKAFQLLLNCCGVENIFVSGRSNSQDHAWNMVKLDDGNWYWCDLTWDDTPSWEWGISYNYFLVNDAQNVNWLDGGWRGTEKTFLQDHTPNTPQGSSVSFLYSLPARSANAYSEPEGLTLRKTFTADNMTFAVVGYNAVQLINCTAAGAVTVPETVTYNGVEYTVTAIGCMDNEGYLGSSINGNKVFSDGATSIFIPKTVKFLWEYAVYCPTNTYITVDGENGLFCSVDGVLFTKSMKTLLCYPSMRAGDEYRIPEQTKQTAFDAFAIMENLTRLYVGKNLAEEGIMCAGTYQDNSINVYSDNWRNIANWLKYSDKIGIVIDEENPLFSSDENWVYNKNKTYACCYFQRETENIFIPAHISGMSSNIFSNYFNLKSFAVDNDNASFAAVGGVLYNKDITQIIFIPLKLSGTFTLPETVTQLGNLKNHSLSTAFVTRHNITEINLSNTLKVLGKDAISRCAKLERINYGGTAEEWLAIEKAEDWYTPNYNNKTVFIYCSDGVVLDTDGNAVNV